MPGDPKPATILDVLDDIEDQLCIDFNQSRAGLDPEAVPKGVLIERHSSSISISIMRGQHLEAIA